ncbi:MAG TPA: hypothetical protein VGT00_04850 [Methylomirabilota bacterium]|nr:hypothetical protein [Methylomirabilota bacterium]
MSESERPTQFGRTQAPDEAWLAKQPSELILDPDLPIIAQWNAFKRIASGASADEKRALFNGTARRVYRLD